MCDVRDQGCWTRASVKPCADGVAKLITYRCNVQPPSAKADGNDGAGDDERAGGLCQATVRLWGPVANDAAADDPADALTPVYHMYRSRLDHTCPPSDELIAYIKRLCAKEPQMKEAEIVRELHENYGEPRPTRHAVRRVLQAMRPKRVEVANKRRTKGEVNWEQDVYDEY